MAAALMTTPFAHASMLPLCTCWRLQGSSSSACCWTLSTLLRCRQVNLEVYIDGAPAIEVEIN